MSTVPLMIEPSREADGPAMPSRFEDDAIAVLAKVRRGFGRLIEAVPGPVRGAGDLQRALGIDKALGWQVFRVGSAADPVAVGPDVPRPVPLAKALRAASARGVPPGVIAEVREACGEFERLIAEHAGDRGSFDAMVRGLREAAPQIHAKDRRAAFRANRAIWGQYADVDYACAINRAGGEPGTEDILSVIGYVGIHALRPSVKVHLTARNVIWGTSKAAAGLQLAQGRTDGLLAEFSSTPLPPLSTREVQPGVLDVAIEPGSLGRAGAVTYLLRSLSLGTPKKADTWWALGRMSRLPSEVMVVDLLVPEGWSDPRLARVLTYGTLGETSPGQDYTMIERVPVAETVSYLGRDPDGMRTPYVPRCSDMIQHVLRDAGWAKERFDIYRCVVKHPILGARVSVQAFPPGASPE